MEFNATFLVSAISFILFTLIMNKIFYAPILKIICERQKFIDDSLENAKNLNIKADCIIQDKEEKIKKCIEDSNVYVANKKNEANIKARNIISDAKIMYQNKIKNSKANLQEQEKALNKDLESKTDELSEIIVSKIMGV